VVSDHDDKRPAVVAMPISLSTDLDGTQHLVYDMVESPAPRRHDVGHVLRLDLHIAAGHRPRLRFAYTDIV
jgi:hypothetical protein